MMGFIIGLSIILALMGYLLPIPSVILAWREWLKGREIPAARAWRRTVSHTSVLLLSVGLAMWAYAIIREASHHDYSYLSLSADVGRWGSFGLFVISAFAESKLRRYLLLGAAGLWFFFWVSIGDIAI